MRLILDILEHIEANTPETTRCMDCIWFECGIFGDTFCSHPKGLYGSVAPTDFCCHAKRRTVPKEGD